MNNPRDTSVRARLERLARATLRATACAVVPKDAPFHKFCTAVGPRAGAAGAPKKTSKTYEFRFTLVIAMTRNALICFLALFLNQAAHADSIKDALNHKYKHQILALRSPFTKGDLKFDSAGQSLS